INIGHLRHKESNRLEALKTEMEKIGISVKTTQDSMEWTGARLPIVENEVIECYDDHRIAMSFAPAAIKLGYVTIRDPQCVDKSFPDYFEEIRKVGGK
ncbi:MAG: 3-phosphoshikimate 1-carboxyvinyltransferase, partial [Muribaculaceae bacterium]|nr:3-phosphoshikimate 1-carboxyvinyltransferase [Muribaculaceae bacterium]